MAAGVPKLRYNRRHHDFESHQPAGPRASAPRTGRSRRPRGPAPAAARRGGAPPPGRAKAVRKHRGPGACAQVRARPPPPRPPSPPEPLPLQLELDEQRVLQEAMSDEFDVSTLLDTDDQLSFRRPGIGLDVTHKLRAGQWSIQRQLDLHGLRVDEAREALGQFIRLSHRTGIRCVRVVHGKGLGSPGKTPVLKGRVLRWLVQKKEVLAFVQARPAEGGAGALVVLLQPGKRQLY
ncbi:hypothetical protein F3K36_27975 [Delftia sp. BR1]|nr:hypothetical protein F3K36_27975 [Delftia sp. BR1]